MAPLPSGELCHQCRFCVSPTSRGGRVVLVLSVQSEGKLSPAEHAPEGRARALSWPTASPQLCSAARLHTHGQKGAPMQDNSGRHRRRQLRPVLMTDG